MVEEYFRLNTAHTFMKYLTLKSFIRAKSLVTQKLEILLTITPKTPEMRI